MYRVEMVLMYMCTGKHLSHVVQRQMVLVLGTYVLQYREPEKRAVGRKQRNMCRRTKSLRAYVKTGSRTGGGGWGGGAGVEAGGRHGSPGAPQRRAAALSPPSGPPFTGPSVPQRTTRVTNAKARGVGQWKGAEWWW